MSVIPNQSYLVKQMQYRLAAAFSRVMWDLGANCKGNADAWKKNPNDNVWGPTAWRKDHQVFHLKENAPFDKGGNHNPCNVQFKNARFDPNLGQIIYGDKRIGQNLQVQDDGKAKIIRNNSDSAVHVAYEESVEITDSFSSSVTKGVSLDMTHETSHDMSSETTAEVKVSGEYMGVTAEAGLSETFGVSMSSTDSRTESRSQEEAKEKSEEGTRAESLAIEFDASPRSHYLVTISKEHVTTYQDFDIHGVMDFDIHLWMNMHSGAGAGSRHSHYRPSDKIELVGMDAFEQFCHGYDTDYPKMQGFYEHCYWSTRQAIDWLMDPKNRFISVSGTNTASLESNASYAVEALGDSVPGPLSHLPVVEAVDV